MERDVGVQDADQGHARKIEALRHHLGAEQDVAGAAREVGDDRGRATALARDVGVEAQEPRLRVERGDLAFRALRPGAGEAEQPSPAHWTLAERRLVMVAVVTAPRARTEMQRERDVTMGALRNETARAALGVMRVAAPI